jgi:ParB family chromosome partitioning protein
LRLLKLPPEIQLGIRLRKISMGHARALINVEDPETQIMIFHQIIHYDFSVRKVEDVVRELTSEDHKPATKKARPSADVKQYREKLSHKFKCKVDVKKSPDGKGKIILSFNDNHEFDKIIRQLTRE